MQGCLLALPLFMDGVRVAFVMELNYFIPRADLREYVRAYYHYATDVKSVQPMCAELGNIRVLLNGSGRVHFPDGDETDFSTAFLLGPTTGAYKMTANAGTRVFGVGIRPRGWGALLGINANETADQVYDLTAFIGRVAGCAIEEIRNAPDFRAMADAADRFFTGLIRIRENRRRAYPDAFEQWLRNPDNLDLDRLVEMMDVSRRQTDRVAKQYFGASPKLLQRKYRALRAADRIRSCEKLSVAAAGDAFYDQSHFIREFKNFIGVTPGQFMNSEAELIGEVQTKRQLAAVHLPLASI